MFKRLFNLFFETKKPSSLPSNEELAKRMSEARDISEYPRYFGPLSFHKYWYGRDADCPRECGYCGFCWFLSVGVSVIGSLFALGMATTLSGRLLGLLLVNTSSLINFGGGLVGMWNRRRKTYRNNLALINSNDKERWKQILPDVRKKTIESFDRDIAELEKGFGPYKESEAQHIKHRAWVADEKNSVGNRVALMERIDKDLEINRNLQTALAKRIGDVKSERELALCKLGEIEAAITISDTEKNSVAPMPCPSQSQKALDMINHLAIEVGTSTFAVPEMAFAVEELPDNMDRAIDLAAEAMVDSEEKRRGSRTMTHSA